MRTAPETAAKIRDAYMALFGSVPESIERRLAVAERADRLTAIEAIERLREVLIHDNPLGLRTQQLVHVGQLLVLAEANLRAHMLAAR